VAREPLHSSGAIKWLETHTLPHSHVVSVEQPWVGTTHFQTCMYMQDVLCNVIECIMKLKCWFCGPDKGAFYAYAYIIYIYTVYV
jgi:hypothetical protein